MKTTERAVCYVVLCRVITWRAAAALVEGSMILKSEIIVFIWMAAEATKGIGSSKLAVGYIPTNHPII